MTTTASVRKYHRERTAALVKRRNAAGLCGRCGAEPRKVAANGRVLKNGEACIAGETGRIAGKKAAIAARSAT